MTVSMLLDFLFGGGVGLRQSDNIQALGEIIEI